MNIEYTFAGALTGFVVGLTGVGGGALMTPLLLLVFGFQPTTAVATDLWFATITKMAALGIHQKNQQIDWKVVRRMWWGSLPAAACVTAACYFGVLSKIQPSFLSSLIGCAVLVTALGVLLKGRMRLESPPAAFYQLKKLQVTFTVVAGLLLGLMVSLTSVGAGVLGSVILLYLYPTRLTPQKLVGTDIAHAIPLALVAGLGYLMTGYVDTSLLSSLLVGSVPAAILGSLFSSKVSQRTLRIALVTILSFSAIKLMLI